MRGTGCSGGAYDFFEPLQSLDGYDVIETISRQPWVLHNKVGMMGISYGGISQLFTAQLNPPSLAAKAAGSFIRCMNGIAARPIASADWLVLSHAVWVSMSAAFAGEATP